MSEAAAPAAPAEAKSEAPKADAPAVDPKAAKTEAPKAETKVEAKPKHKITVDGKDEEVELEELIRRAQLSSAADKRFREAAEFKKTAEEKHAQTANLMQMMLNDPVGFAEAAKAYGLNPEDFATKILTPILQAQVAAEEEKLMTPEQRRVRELERKVAAAEAADQKRKADEEKAAKAKLEAEQKAAVERRTNEFAQTIMDAMKKTTLPQTPDTALAIHELMQVKISRGLPVSAEDLARDFEAQRKAELSALLKASGTSDWLDPEFRKAIRKEAIDDPEIVEAIRKKAVEEFKKSNPMAAAKPAVAAPVEKNVASKRKTFNSIMRDISLKKLD